MARGLVLGSTLISFFSFIMGIITAYAPSWLILRTESSEDFCWWGEGIYQSRVFFGKDLGLIDFKCQDPRNIGPISTYQAYCSSNPVDILNDKDLPDYAAQMCTKTNQAKITSNLVIFCSIIPIIIGIFLHSTRLKRKYEMILTLVAFIFSILTMLFSLTTLVIMWTSPLFSRSHISALSAEHVGIPFDGFASCSLTTPLRSIFTLMVPAPLECLFPGPSFVAPFILFVGQGIGTFNL